MPNRLDGTGLSRLVAKLKEYMYSFALNTGTISTLPMIIQDARITESHIVENDYVFSDLDLGWVTTAGKLILYGTLPSGTSKPSVKLYLRKVAGLTADAVTVSLRLQTSNSTSGNYLVADGKNMIPGTQYTWRLMKAVSGGTDVQVYSVGKTTYYPTDSYWFQEVPRSLEDGESYYVQLKTTAGSETPAESGTVEFEGGANVPAS